MYCADLKFQEKQKTAWEDHETWEGEDEKTKVEEQKTAAITYWRRYNEWLKLSQRLWRPYKQKPKWSDQSTNHISIDAHITEGKPKQNEKKQTRKETNKEADNVSKKRKQGNHNRDPIQEHWKIQETNRKEQDENITQNNTMRNTWLYLLHHQSCVPMPIMNTVMMMKDWAHLQRLMMARMRRYALVQNNPNHWLKFREHLKEQISEDTARSCERKGSKEKEEDEKWRSSREKAMDRTNSREGSNARHTRSGRTWIGWIQITNIITAWRHCKPLRGDGRKIRSPSMHHHFKGRIFKIQRKTQHCQTISHWCSAWAWF